MKHAYTPDTLFGAYNEPVTSAAAVQGDSPSKRLEGIDGHGEVIDVV